MADPKTGRSFRSAVRSTSSVPSAPAGVRSKPIGRICDSEVLRDRCVGYMAREHTYQRSCVGSEEQLYAARDDVAKAAQCRAFQETGARFVRPPRSAKPTCSRATVSCRSPRQVPAVGSFTVRTVRHYVGPHHIHPCLLTRSPRQAFRYGQTARGVPEKLRCSTPTSLRLNQLGKFGKIIDRVPASRSRLATHTEESHRKLAALRQ